MRVPLLALMAIAAAACGGPTEVQLEEDFILALGKSAAVEGTGITVTFAGVLEDSRCPINAVCVRAGNAKVVLGLQNPTRSAEVNIPDQPRGVFIDRIEIRLIELNPAPEVGKELDEGSYRVTLRAIQHNSAPVG